MGVKCEPPNRHPSNDRVERGRAGRGRPDNCDRAEDGGEGMKPGLIVLIFAIALAGWLALEDRGMLPADPFTGVDAALMQMGEGW